MQRRGDLPKSKEVDHLRKITWYSVSIKKIKNRKDKQQDNMSVIYYNML